MAHQSVGGLYETPPPTIARTQGKFRITVNHPGRALPDHGDHGYGPLAAVVESFMDPDTLISMHQHRNEEIVSWVPAGVMRHDDGEGNKLVTDAEHVMAMGAGSGFWHEERTLPGDPPLRMLQIFVRPHSLDLPPGIQHEPVPDPVVGEWRHVFQPQGEDGDAPLAVRNDVHLYDVRLGARDAVAFPTREGWDTYFYVFDGAVDVDGVRFGTADSGLLVDAPGATVAATEDTTMVAFLLNPDADVTRQGTIGR
jgi:redox-sensitive bicupin YhaK (pirin superfamily)